MDGLTHDEMAVLLRDLLLSSGAHERRRYVPGPANVDDVLVGDVAARIDAVRPLRDRIIDRAVAWKLLIAAVNTNAATADEQRLLLAARHLLAVGPDPRRPDAPAPYDDTLALIASIGVNSAGLQRRAKLQASSVRYRKSIVFRRFYAVVASGLGDTVDTLRPDKNATTDRLGQAVASAYEKLLRNDAVLAKLVDESADDDPLPDPKTPRRLSIWQWGAIGGAATLVIAIGIVAANVITATSEGLAEQVAPLVSLESVASPRIKWNINSVFWVPTTAPIEELEAFPRGCFDDRAQEWLRSHGVYRDTYFFTVRNLTEETIGLGQVTARGTASPAQPGLLIACSGGGEGGQIEWSQLALTLAPDEVATLKDPTRPSEYFWRDLASGEKGGIQIFPNGEQDFTGTLTVDITPLRGDVQHLTVPDLDTVADRTIEWHAVPSGKQLLYRLPSPDDATTCSVNDAPLSDCTVANLRTVLNQLWG